MTKSAWSLCELPFFEPAHYDLATRARDWCSHHALRQETDFTAECRRIVRDLGEAGLLHYAVPQRPDGFDLRSICVIREGLTYHHPLVDAMFTMQGIGTIAIQQFGSAAQKATYLAPCRDGSHIAAFALTEPEAGSDVASLATTAVRDGDDYVIDGEKTLISNAGFADHYIVVARTGEAPRSRGLSAFLVDADRPGFSAGPPLDFIAEHPGGPIRFDACRVPASAMLGEPGQGFTVAMAAFEVFRPSVGAAGIGLARRAMEETLARVTRRQLFGKPMSEMQSVQMTLADMAADIDSAALTVYRAGWSYDVLGQRRSAHGPMAKLVGTEAAGRVVDRAVQLSGGMGVVRGNVIEQLYRDARPMRIYEGASEVQKQIIARSLLADFLAQ
jgi:acyl-CoA dehydrogenase